MPLVKPALSVAVAVDVSHFQCSAHDHKPVQVPALTVGCVPLTPDRDCGL